MTPLRRITRAPAVTSGKPCIRGMRVTVGTLVGLLAVTRGRPSLRRTARPVHLAVLIVAATTAAGCSSSVAPGSPTVTAGQVSGQLAIVPLATDAMVVGANVQLVPVITLGDAAQPQPADAVAWSSSNDSVAKVSARGVLSAVAPGNAVVTAAAKTQSASLSVDVVPSVAGAMTAAWIALDCSQLFASCFGGPPRPYLGRVFMTQSGSRVDGTWDMARDWPRGAPPFSGRIRADGSMDLSGRHCYGPDDNDRYTLYSLSTWQMSMTSASAFSGRMTSSQEGGFGTGDCSGSPPYRGSADFKVELMR